MKGTFQTSSVVGMIEDPECSLVLKTLYNSICDLKLEFLKMSLQELKHFSRGKTCICKKEIRTVVDCKLYKHLQVF